MSDESPAEEYAFLGDITDYWTYTQARDLLWHMPGLTDPALRMYLIVRSMIAETKKNLPGQGLRRMTIDQMCFLLTRDTGKPVSYSLMYQILALLEELDLMVPHDTKQDVGASQLKGKEKATRAILRGFMVRDLPPAAYTGWRNSWDKLNHYRPDWRENPPVPPTHVTETVVDDKGRPLSKVIQVPQDVAFQDSGTESEGPGEGQDPFQDSGKGFQDSGTGFQEAGTVSPSTSDNAAPKQGSSTTLSKKKDAPSARSASDARSASTSGSRGSSKGGCAASGKTKPSPLTREQRQQVQAVRLLLPVDLNKALGSKTPRLVTDAVLEALAAGEPHERTPEQLVKFRVEKRWNGFWASKFYAGELSSGNGGPRVVGPLKAMLERKQECGSNRCDDRVDVDSAETCRSCEARSGDKRAARTAERVPAQPAPEADAPAPASPRSLPAARTRVDAPDDISVAVEEVVDAPVALAAAREALKNRPYARR